MVKKYLIGGAVGVLLATTASVYADDLVPNLIGKSVEGTFKVKLNGNTVSKDAIVVDGSSYLPVRAAGEALGLNVDFQNNEVLLNNVSSEEKGDQMGGTVRFDENLPESTYEGIRTIKYNDQTYFQLFQYNDKHRDAVIKFDSNLRTLSVKGKVIDVDHADPSDLLFYKGNTFLNISYYPK
jgi:hypothetical protein